MIRTSEFVSPGHPDAVADFIVSYLLDRYLEQDPLVRFAVECQIKDNFVTLGGEITTIADISREDIVRYVKDAVRKIGYTEEYAAKWGDESCINPSKLEVVIHMGRQSPDIAQGVNADGWGDQGIFWGMACGSDAFDLMPEDHWYARELGMILFDLARSGTLAIGLDIKTQITMDGDKVVGVIVAAPMRGDKDELAWLEHEVRSIALDVTGIANAANIVINGTGAYVRHASQGDCGTTGRKLAVDFYGGNCRIGGGAPWGKDPSKADVTLNLYARELAKRMLEKTDGDCVYCAISCCIGRKEITVAYFDEHMNQLASAVEIRPAPGIIEELGLRRPVFASKKWNGLFSSRTGIAL